LPRNSRRDRGSLLIAAVSGRALAQSAGRAGFTPLVADFFADADTQDMAHACHKVPGSIAGGFRRATIGPALEALAELAPSPLLGVVYGSGFEDRTELLSEIGKSWPLLGTDPATVARLKDPEHFFAALDRLGIAHPQTARRPPSRGDGSWLAKKRGGAGGSHIRPSRLAKVSPNIYFQERVEGRALSALFVANGCDARLLGFSEQWAAPRTSSRWRYGGAVCPATISAELARRMASAVRAVARTFAIKGVASADFIVRDEAPLLLEINPRPGATLDIFDRGRTKLLRLHMETVLNGKLPSHALKVSGAMASAIVYAEHGGRVPAHVVWPAWVADRPRQSEWIDKNRPICTVLARAATAALAKNFVEARRRVILEVFQSIRGRPGEPEGQQRRLKPGNLAKRQHRSGAARPGTHR
jgi:uncharacterized protein